MQRAFSSAPLALSVHSAIPSNMSEGLDGLYETVAIISGP